MNKSNSFNLFIAFVLMILSAFPGTIAEGLKDSSEMWLRVGASMCEDLEFAMMWGAVYFLFVRQPEQY